MSDLAELVPKINAATSAIQNLKGSTHSRGSKELKLKVLRSLHGSIQEARVRGVSYKALAEAIHKTTEMKLTGTTLRKYLLILQEEEDAAVKSMSKKLSEQFKKA